MKTFALTLSLAFVVLSLSCNKEDTSYSGDITRDYSIEGYIRTAHPDGYKAYLNRTIGLNQSTRYDIKITDPMTSIDSDGHFKITYRPSSSGKTVALYFRPSDYNCITTVWNVASGVQKGVDVNLGKVYIGNSPTP